MVSLASAGRSQAALKIVASMPLLDVSSAVKWSLDFAGGT